MKAAAIFALLLVAAVGASAQSCFLSQKEAESIDFKPLKAACVSCSPGSKGLGERSRAQAYSTTLDSSWGPHLESSFKLLASLHA